MNQERRVDSLEERAKWRIEAQNPGNLRLFDAIGNDVEGEIIQIPTPEQDGLARLLDGSEKPIAYEDGWESHAMIGTEPGLKAKRDDKASEVLIDEGDTSEHKLRIRRGDAFAFVGVDLSSFSEKVTRRDPELRGWQEIMSECLRNKKG